MPNHGEPLICPCYLDLPPTALPKAGDSNGVCWGYGSEVERSLLKFIFLPSWALLPLAGPGHLCLCELLHTSKFMSLLPVLPCSTLSPTALPEGASNPISDRTAALCGEKSHTVWPEWPSVV